eukprot:SAG31_NODE_7467_length_1681_cov_8.587863_3_plen_210_part_00
MVERTTLYAWRSHFYFCRRYVDDVGVILRGNQESAAQFISDYRSALSTVRLECTDEVSHTEMVMLDQHMSKGELWSQFGWLDLQVYQKPLSTFAYIPFASDHAPHIRRAWIRGELLRYAKRSNSPLAFAEVRLQFARRLLSRGYPPEFLQPLFDAVSFNDRWQQLLVKAKAIPSNTVIPHQRSVVCMRLGIAVYATSGRARSAIGLIFE